MHERERGATVSIEMEDVSATVRGWLREHVTGDRAIRDDEALIEGGLLTSLQTVELVLFLDEHFGIEVDDDEFVEDNFQTVEAIARLVQSKRG
jgi:methoxymalonate biosynthesis acyl carrier protein